MKNILIILLLAGAVVFGALFLWQHNQTNAQAERLAKARAELAQAQKQAQQQDEAAERARLAETKANILQETLKQTAGNVEAQSNKVAELRAALQTNQPNPNPFAGLLKDPKMRDIIKTQQKLAIGPLIEKNYGAAFLQLHLTPDQTASLKELIQTKMLAAADSGMSMMDNSLTAAQRADTVKQIKAESESYDSQMKQLLGDENYAAFQSYEKTVPDRMMAGQFFDQVTGTGNALSPEQQQQLIQAMTEERTTFKWTTDFGNRDPGSVDPMGMFTEDKLNAYAQERAQFDQLVLNRARQFLTPSQVSAYEPFLSQQRELQIAAMKMAATMFGK